MSEAKGIRQRLAAILAADAAGYSRLMAQDEQATVAALDAAREAFRAAIQAHGGHVIDMAGDSVLAVFETAASAVSTALDVQQALEALADGVPADRRMRFRIGVHMGDIIEKPDGTVYGDGVNIAARLEGLALPGGITVSDAVRGSVRHRVAATFEDLGDQQVKNITDPVRAFRVTAKVQGGEAALGTLGKPVAASWLRRLRWLAMGVLAVGLAAGVAAYLTRDPGGPASASGPPLLSLAVLPFKSAGGSAPDPFADAFTRAVTAELARTVIGRPVVPADTVAAYRGELGDVRAVGKELNVRYLVQGEIRRQSGQVVVDARLVDAPTRVQAWAGRIDTPETRLVDFPELAVLRAANAMRVALVTAELRRLPAQPARDASALELVFRGNFMAFEPNGDLDSNKAMELCDAALRQNPKLAAGLWGKAVQVERDLDSSPDRTLDSKRIAQMEELTLGAVTLDDLDPVAWNLRADALRHQFRWAAMAEARTRALQLGPSRHGSYADLAWDMIHLGRPAEALHALAKELEIKPDVARDFDYQAALCRTHLALGQFDEAIASCEKAVSGRASANQHIWLAAAYAQKGDAAKAAAERDRALARWPGLTVAAWRANNWKDSDNPNYREQYERNILSGMRKAGFAEQ